jgi:hypothetical protein
MNRLIVVCILFMVLPLWSHPITVDGDPSDWIGTPPGVDSFTVDMGEGIWTDSMDDDLGDGGDAPNAADNPGPYTYPTDASFLGTEADIVEWRVTAEPLNNKLYFLVKINDFEETWIPMVAILLDLDHVAGSGNNWFPNEADLLVSPINSWEYCVVLFDNQIVVYDTAWNVVTGASEVSFSTVNDVIEAGVDVSGWDIDPFTTTIYFTVGAGLQDYGNFREVDSLESQWQGGGGIGPGGSYPWTDPDIYDICFVPAANQPENLNMYFDQFPLTSLLLENTVQPVNIPDLISSPNLLINEFIATPTAQEAIEIYNASNWEYDLGGFKVIVTGYTFEDTITINSGVVAPAGGYVVISDANVTGDLTLPNEGAIIHLLDPNFNLLDEVGYGSMGGAPAPIYAWSAARSPDGNDTDYDAGDFNMDPTPTMGSANDAPPANLGNTDVVINEVKTASTTSGDPFIELINTSSSTVDLSNWMIVVDDEYIIPSGTSIDPGGFYLLPVDSFPQYFSMDFDGDNLYLFNGSGERVDQMGWWSQDPGDQSYAVRPDGMRTTFDGYDLATSPDFVLADPTPGDSNGVPYVETVFFDDFESGLNNWTGDWGLQQDTAYSGIYSYTDSPNSLPPNMSTIIGEMANGVDLTPYLNAFLEFYYMHWIEQGFDYGYLDVSPDGGNTWITVKTYNDTVDVWTLEHIDLSGFVYSNNFKIRFRLVTDPAYVETGWFVDDVHIIGYYIDVAPPLIVHTPPADTESIEDDFIVVADFLDASGISDDSLYYSIDGGPFVPTYHDSVSGNTFYFTIPQQDAGTYVSYYFKVVDASDSLWTSVSDTFHYFAGRVWYFDDADPDYITQFLQDNMIGVMFTVPQDSQANIAILAYNFYMDPNTPLDSVEVHLWGEVNGFPGSDLITPFTIWPSNTPEEPQAWTYVDIRDSNVVVAEDDFFVGCRFYSQYPALLIDSPGSFMRSYYYDGTQWQQVTQDFYIRCIVGVEPSGVSEKQGERPTYFAFYKPYPNPAVNSVSIRYALPVDTDVKLNVYDKTGRLVKTLVDEKEKAGIREIIWDGKDADGRKVPAGVYFMRLEAGGFKKTHKVILLQ